MSIQSKEAEIVKHSRLVENFFKKGDVEARTAYQIIFARPFYTKINVADVNLNHADKLDGPQSSTVVEANGVEKSQEWVIVGPFRESSKQRVMIELS
jgi:hypothetical protein